VAIITLHIEAGTGRDAKRSHDRELDLAVEAAELPPERESPGRARRLVVDALRERGCGEALVNDAALVVTELASNAVLHVHSSFSISVQRRDAILRVAVGDRTPPDATTPNGGLIQRPTHGLGLVDAVSTRWGVEPTPDGKVVWAELACEPRRARRFQLRASA
jgi:hypothetical protein